MTEPAERAKPPSLGDLVGLLAFLVGLITAWLYVAGWTYAYHYFDRFGIPLLMVDIPKENYFVYGGIVVQQFPLWGLGFGLALLLAASLWRWIGAVLGRVALPLGLVVVAAVFWLGHKGGIAAAHQLYSEQRQSDYSAYPRVQVWPKEETKLPAGSPLASGDLIKGCYRLILYNQDRSFLVRPFKGAAAADLPVLIIPWDQVGPIRVLAEYTSCE
jgi:MFS family permease